MTNLSDLFSDEPNINVEWVSRARNRIDGARHALFNAVPYDALVAPREGLHPDVVVLRDNLAAMNETFEALSTWLEETGAPAPRRRRRRGKR